MCFKKVCSMSKNLWKLLYCTKFKNIFKNMSAAFGIRNSAIVLKNRWNLHIKKAEKSCPNVIGRTYFTGFQKNLWYPKSIEGIVSKKIETYRTCFHNIRFSRYIENAFKRSVVVPKYRHKLAYCKNINVKVLINIPPTFAPNISVMMLK